MKTVSRTVAAVTSAAFAATILIGAGLGGPDGSIEAGKKSTYVAPTSPTFIPPAELMVIKPINEDNSTPPPPSTI